MAKKNSLPVNKNDDITLKIDSVTGQGCGIGRYEGLAVFVDGALMGEEVFAHVIKVKSSYAVGKLKSILSPSKDRVEPKCTYCNTCGGCTLQHLEYGAQLQVKQEQVKDAMERLGGFKEIKVLPIIGMENPKRYRNKGSFPFGITEDGKISTGFFKQHSHTLVPIEDCIIQKNKINDAVKAVREWANKYNIPPYNEQTREGILRHVMVRTNSDESEVMTVIVTTGPLMNVPELIEIIKEKVDGLVSIIHNVNKKDTNVIFGDEFDVIWGKDTITETMDGVKFNVSAPSFLQVNPTQTIKLYDEAIKRLSLTGNETVVDVYCGIGTMSLLIAKKAKQVVGIEIVKEAIADARKNAINNNITNAEFICADAEEAFPKIAQSGTKIDAVMLDPPRKGCDEATLNAIINAKIEKVVYVSCNPATLARDCRILCDNGYETDAVQSVDMFPHSGHVESVVSLKRRNELQP